MVRTLRDRSCKVERKRGERYSQEFHCQTVERMYAIEN
jgi:hypothetical protein